MVWDPEGRKITVYRDTMLRSLRDKYHYHTTRCYIPQDYTFIVI